MKVVKGIAILSFFSVLFGSCFDPPEFPVTPQIGFQDLTFHDVQNPGLPDSLVLSITFRDGDGDLGLDQGNPLHFSPPFHSADYFRTNANGELVKVPSFSAPVTGKDGKVQFYDVLEITAPASGDLVFPRTRKNPAYSTLPAYSCVDYSYRPFIVNMNAKEALDDLTVILDSLENQNNRFLLVRDSVYQVPNPDHFNIEVDFLIKEGSEFVEFDFRKELCSTFDGRFPTLSDKEGTALDGSLKYSMESMGFYFIIGSKPFKLRILIRDRARNVSNVLETEEFTLQGIRK